MHEDAARALQYYEDLPRRSGRGDLRLVEDRAPRHAGSVRLIEAEAHPRRADRISHAPMAEVRTIRVDSGRHHAPRRRQAAAPRLAGRPDRVAMWAVLLGFFLTAVAAATGHA